MLREIHHPHQPPLYVLSDGIGLALRIFALFHAQIAIKCFEQDPRLIRRADAQQVTQRREVVPLAMLDPRRDHLG